MTTIKSYKSISKTDWGSQIKEGQHPTQEQITLGAILRIADATEAMAIRHTDLIDENERLKERVNY